jgi:N-sulfoglucosamine sulfohydrolase
MSGWQFCSTLVLYLVIAGQPTARGAAVPNVLLLIGDNWSWPHAGALGDGLAKTPTFDRLAREGLIFENAFCPVPSCSPTRACLLTGRAAHQLEDAANLWSIFPRKLRTFTQDLRAAGWEVGFTGKGWSPGQYKEVGWPENPVGPEYEDFAAFLDQRATDSPFFFWLGNIDTSLARWKAAQASFTAEQLAQVQVPPMLPDSAAVRGSILAYYQGIERMDREFGRAVAELEQRGTLDSTMVICTSDNGWQMPRGLANCYDTGVRVPLVARWGQRLAGRKSAHFVSLTDLAPTFLELAALPVPYSMTGRSIASLLVGRDMSPGSDHVFLERERHANVRRGDLSYPIRGIRTTTHLLLWNLRPDRWPAGDPEHYFAVGDYGDVDETLAKQYILKTHATLDASRRSYELCFAKRPEFELYDLGADPHQLVNVAADPEHHAVRTELTARVRSWMERTQDPRVDATIDVWDRYPYYGRAPARAGKAARPTR